MRKNRDCEGWNGEKERKDTNSKRMKEFERKQIERCEKMKRQKGEEDKIEWKDRVREKKWKRMWWS